MPDDSTRLIFAVIAEDAGQDSRGGFHILNPWGAFLLPRREDYAPHMPLTINIEQPFVIVLGLFGERIDPVALTVTVFHADNSYGRAYDARLERESRYSVHVIPIPPHSWTIPTPGPLDFRILADGEPIGSYSVVVDWQDESPSDVAP